MTNPTETTTMTNPTETTTMTNPTEITTMTNPTETTTMTNPTETTTMTNPTETTTMTETTPFKALRFTAKLIDAAEAALRTVQARNSARTLGVDAIDRGVDRYKTALAIARKHGWDPSSVECRETGGRVVNNYKYAADTTIVVVRKTGVSSGRAHAEASSGGRGPTNYVYVAIPQGTKARPEAFGVKPILSKGRLCWCW